MPFALRAPSLPGAPFPVPPGFLSRLLPGILLGSALFLPGAPAGAQERGGGAPAVSVAVAPATVGPVPVEVLTNGNAEAPSVISVRSRVDGQVEKVWVNEGDRVQAGQVLFTLDSRLIQAQLAQQQANLDRDRSTLTRAQEDARRYASLQSGAYASQQRLEQAQADATAAAAVVRADEALLAQTRLNLDFATIRAEAPGRLGALPVKAGNFVRASEGVVLATITQTDPILVTFAVPERWLSVVHAAQQGAAAGQSAAPRVLARAPEDQGPRAEGELIFVDSTVDSTTGTIRMKGRFANAPARFWPGQYLEVVLVPRTDPKALSVPAAAVQRGQQGSFLYAVKGEGDNAAARRVAVSVVRYAAGRAVLADASLSDGEPVVTEGAQRLQDGTHVTVRSGAPGGAPAGAPKVGGAEPGRAQREAAAR
ncbi:efflux RND transporter periplasmic adaptor subunit [Roseomonas gilardii]|uniref:efflux RND transporter periplasmic adaptor subunit n=1 Tax=Roseomonas gilardii TaxID=257708 RepID=UPI0021B6253D|nr:efflux RND transporter periplasmic adaptor subunit [Roseomonas gilardii]